jgi:hypothetical protein
VSSLSFSRSVVPLKFTLAVFLASLLVSCLGHYKRATNRHYAKIVRTRKTYDAVIVPGIPYSGSGWGTLMRARVIWSWVLYKNGIAKNVIYSGGAVYTPYNEAEVMGLYARELGIPKEHIFYDTCAQHSTENVFFSFVLAKEKGFKNLAVASDIYQCFFLRNFIKRKFFKGHIEQLPFVKDTVDCYNTLNLCIDPAPAQISDPHTFVPLTERENYFARMRGTLGWNINWKEKEGEKSNAALQ